MPNQERLDRMRRAMELERLDALIVRWPENTLLLSGYWPMIGTAVLLFPREGPSVCAVPHCYENEAASCLWEAKPVFYKYGILGAAEPLSCLRKILSDAGGGKRWSRIGHDAGFEAVAPSWNSAELFPSTERTIGLYASAFSQAEIVDASSLLHSERRCKTTYELDKIRTASEISCFGLEAFARSVEPGVSGVELAALVERDVMVRGTGFKGASRVRAYAQVAAGTEETAVGYRPNEISTQRRISHGDPVLLELGVVADGYWADRTRVRVAGEPAEEQLKVFHAVRAAQEAAIAAARPGMSGEQVDAVARSIIQDKGYAAMFPHITGHGVGFAYHEAAPKLAPGSHEVLAAGMVSSVEPGIYFNPCGGYRIEDDIVITPGGCEVLGPFAKDLN